MTIRERRFYCDHCDRRAAKGGITLSVAGPIHVRRVNTGSGNLYCSERCLRDALAGIGPEDDPQEILQDRIRSLERQLRTVRRELEEERHYGSRNEIQDSVRQAADLVEQIKEHQLTRTVDTSERGRLLCRILTNLDTAMKGALRAVG